MQIYRGDTWSQTVDCENFSLKQGDVIKIGVKQYIGEIEYALYRVIQINKEQTSFDFTFTSEETAKIIPADNYVFEIELTSGDEITTLYQSEIAVKGDVIANG